MKHVVQKAGVAQWEKAAAQMRTVRRTPPDSYNRKLWAELDAETDVASGKAPLERATLAQDGRDMLSISTWLRWRVLAENADARYSYAYASNLHYMRDANGGFQKEAAMFLLHARLALEIDGARCIDQASPQSVVMGYEAQPYIRPLLDQVGKMTKRDRALALLDAVAIEEMRGERPLLPGLCTRGARSMLRAMAAGRQPESISASDPRAANSIGKTFAVDVSGLEPELTTEDQWRKKRRGILDSAIKNVSEAL
jgi:hypothetical protein